MELTLGDMAVIMDALKGRLRFQDNSGGAWDFDRETYENLLHKLINSSELAFALAFAVEVVDDKKKEEKG